MYLFKRGLIRRLCKTRIVAVAHNCTVVNEKDEEIDVDYPECKKSEYTIRDYLLGIMPGQTATVMSINYMKIPLFDLTVFDKVPGPGDKIKYFALVTNGKIYCEQCAMSAYRLVKTTVLALWQIINITLIMIICGIKE